MFSDEELENSTPVPTSNLALKAFHPILKSLSSFLEPGALSHSGTLPVPLNSASIFYSSPKGTGVLNLATATDSDLERLTQACEPASFGVNDQDVLDEAYRKAWKLDTGYFAAQFELPYPFCAKLSQLMLGSSGLDSESALSFELYKLNVYGPGSFFKAHVDTPRQSNMIGSLVVVLPTKHEGGGLVLRNNASEWTLDSANAVSLATDPASPLVAAFAAFYGDIEHEVLPVVSGYRLTLTYNLYRVTPQDVTSGAVEPTSTPIPPKLDLAVQSLKLDIEKLINNPDFLPNGGFLGFHLAHKCAVKTAPGGHADPQELERGLKGVDALLYHVVRDVLGLPCAVRVLSTFDEYDYEYEDECKFMVLTDRFRAVGGCYEDRLQFRIKGNYVFDAETGNEPMGEKIQRFPIVWVGKTQTENERREAFLKYGNDASVGYLYQEICLVAEVHMDK